MFANNKGFQRIPSSSHDEPITNNIVLHQKYCHKSLILFFICLILFFLLALYHASLGVSKPVPTQPSQSVPTQSSQSVPTQPSQSVPTQPNQSGSTLNGSVSALAKSEVVGDDTNSRRIKFPSQVPQLYNNQNRKSMKIPSRVPDTWIDSEKIEQFKELPFCVLVFGSNQQTRVSVEQNDYLNYVIVEVEPTGPLSQNFIFPQYHLNYYKLLDILEQNCQVNAVIMLIKDAIKSDCLRQLNRIYQSSKVWATVQTSNDEVFVHSAYWRMFELILAKDQKGDNRPYLQVADEKIICTAIIELAYDKAFKTTHFSGAEAVLSVSSPFFRHYKRTPYQSVASLGEVAQISKGKKAQYERRLRKWDQNLEGRKAVEYIELIYLPQEHYVAEREKLEKESLYQLNKYEEETAFCVTVPSHNNVEGGRFEKAILSIIQQQYTNFHIVFIDDVSDDGNMLATMKAVKRRKFPPQKINFIQNIQRNLATFNIINAAYNYCRDDEVQVIVDGDDHLIGKHVLRVLNYGYLQTRSWCVYTQYITTDCRLGISAKIQLASMYSSSNQRIPGQKISHVKSWYVAIIKHIKLRDHKRDNGDWLDTISDAAIQFPLIEMAGVSRITFLPTISYYYNNMYGGNEFSTPAKVNRVSAALDEIKKRPIYSQLDSLNFSIQNLQVIDQLKSEKNSRYREVTMEELLSSQTTAHL